MRLGCRLVLTEMDSSLVIGVVMVGKRNDAWILEIRVLQVTDAVALRNAGQTAVAMQKR